MLTDSVANRCALWRNPFKLSVWWSDDGFIVFYLEQARSPMYAWIFTERFYHRSFVRSLLNWLDNDSIVFQRTHSHSQFKKWTTRCSIDNIGAENRFSTVDMVFILFDMKININRSGQAWLILKLHVLISDFFFRKVPMKRIVGQCGFRKSTAKQFIFSRNFWGIHLQINER